MLFWNTRSEEWFWLSAVKNSSTQRCRNISDVPPTREKKIGYWLPMLPYVHIPECGFRFSRQPKISFPAKRLTDVWHISHFRPVKYYRTHVHVEVSPDPVRPSLPPPSRWVDGPVAEYGKRGWVFFGPVWRRSGRRRRAKVPQDGVEGLLRKKKRLKEQTNLLAGSW